MVRGVWKPLINNQPNPSLVEMVKVFLNERNFENEQNLSRKRVQKKTNDKQTKWIAQKHEKIIVF